MNDISMFSLARYPNWRPHSRDSPSKPWQAKDNNEKSVCRSRSWVPKIGFNPHGIVFAEAEVCVSKIIRSHMESQCWLLRSVCDLSQEQNMNKKREEGNLNRGRGL